MKLYKPVRWYCLALLLLVPSISYGKKVADFDINFYRPVLAAADHKNIYLYDIKLVEIYIFPVENVLHPIKFGKKGEGPGEFKWIDHLKVYPGYIFVSGGGKIAYFSMAGNLKKECKVEYATNGYIPLGKNYVCKKYEKNLNIVKIFDSSLKEIKSNLETFEIPPNNVLAANNKIDLYAITDFFGYTVDSEVLYIGNTQKGFYFGVYDTEGRKLYEIRRDFEKRQVTSKDKEELMNRLLNSVGKQRFETAQKKYNYLYPKYFPSYSKFTVNNNRLYVMTYTSLNSKQELLILNPKGNLIKKVLVPTTGDFVEDFYISDGKYYYVKENIDLDKWELHEIEIENK